MLRHSNALWTSEDLRNERWRSKDINPTPEGWPQARKEVIQMGGWNTKDHNHGGPDSINHKTQEDIGVR